MLAPYTTEDYITLYTTEEIITIIYQDQGHKYDVWYDFITKLRPSLNVLLKEGSDYDDNDYNPVFMLEKDFDITVNQEYPENVVESEFLSQLSCLALNHISDPSPVFILDVDEVTAKSVSEKYGVICHSLEESPLNSPLFMESLEKNVDKSEPNRGWHELVVDSTTPANAMVFVDRYLFSKDSGGITYQDGINNVFEVLNHVLPKNLGMDYHVLLVFDASTLSTATGETFKSVSEEINTLIPRLKRPYNIVIEMVSIDRNDFNYDETHNRRILSNYFIIRVDRSLKAFRSSYSLYSQSLFLDWVASKGVIRQKRSDAPAKALYKYLGEVKEAIGQMKKSIGTVPFSRNGDIEPISTLKNRLIQISNSEK